MATIIYSYHLYLANNGNLARRWKISISTEDGPHYHGPSHTTIASDALLTSSLLQKSEAGTADLASNRGLSRSQSNDRVLFNVVRNLCELVD